MDTPLNTNWHPAKGVTVPRDISQRRSQQQRMSVCVYRVRQSVCRGSIQGSVTPE